MPSLRMIAALAVLAATTLPASYTARLTVNGKTYTQTFVVLPDPRAR